MPEIQRWCSLWPSSSTPERRGCTPFITRFGGVGTPFFPDTSFLFVSGYAGKREFR
jgi:hypothetical protein